MRISDHRYNRDRLRFDLALRLMRHEARTCTIQFLTGLTEDRIRKLYRAYFSHCPTGASIPRHRGQSPRQPSIFLQSAAFNFQSTTFASMLCVVGLLGPQDIQENKACPPDIRLTLEQAEDFCLAYETYLGLHIEPQLSFEYAWFLLVSLMKQEGVRLSRCRQCGRLYVEEAAHFESPNCGCSRRRNPWQQRSRLPRKIAQAYLQAHGSENQ